MTAEAFWKRPGVTEALEASGHRVVASDRVARPTSWVEEGTHLVAALDGHVDAVVAGSNGCSAALRLVLDHEVAAPLVLCWPATAGDTAADSVARDVMTAAGVERSVQRSLLDGETLRGVTDDELRAIRRRVAIVPSEPENPLHRRATAERLAELIPQSDLRKGYRESPHPMFSTQCAAFADEVIAAVSDGV